METRQITQVHIFFIVLNCIFDRSENRDIVAVSDDKQKLMEFYLNNLLPREAQGRDENGWFRSFKFGPLYNYNPAHSSEEAFRDDWVPLGNLQNIRTKYLFIE